MREQTIGGTAIVKADVGTWEWVHRTNGILTTSERLSFLPSLVGTFGAFIGDRLRLSLGRRKTLSIGAEELWPVAPDSALCKQALEAARDLQGEAVLNHAWRTWVLGHALARIDGTNLDPELLHAGALLHDTGIEPSKEGQCFTHRSAEAAQGVAQAVSLETERTRTLMNGIVQHITPGLKQSDDALGYYLLEFFDFTTVLFGDLLGLRLWELPRDTLNRVNSEYPRLGIHKELARCWGAEAKAVKGGRAHFVQMWGGFGPIVGNLPWTK